MSLVIQHTRSRCYRPLLVLPTLSSPKSKNRHRPFVLVTRFYATRRTTVDPTTLSQSLDTKQRAFRSKESVGPFQLASSSFNSTERVPKWSELSTAGKVKRTTARTSNLAVIAFGAGLSAVLIYCLTSELFSKNSPTVLYSAACERVKASPEVAKYLPGSLVFHVTPASLERPRHRNHQVSSQIVLDQHNREHMFMNFYVQARSPGSIVSDSYYDSFENWIRDSVASFSEMSYEDMVQWTKDHSSATWERFQRSFKYLTGAPLSPASASTTPSSQTDSEWQQPPSTLSQLTGLFSSLRRTPTSTTDNRQSGQIFTEGEVHADFVRNNDGYFVCRYIMVNIPNSRSPIRIFVERGASI
ncbi:hypothetical protein E1B28_001361 [Marasmius oreades]|uniref:Mitochondrial import inner membrane translocase subunit Tim21 n=1 Tax=Marasmius oreades TaxID=181124 RepID=A0A9P7V394_9AGAR|nr:uncharacterized protein E1B28_001361 [Marasmius oreades]KAG7099518.1 hypothetical protein E1B28_001361 [Marasmius oreades]